MVDTGYASPVVFLSQSFNLLLVFVNLLSAVVVVVVLEVLVSLGFVQFRLQFAELGLTELELCLYLVLLGIAPVQPNLEKQIIN